MTVCVSLPFPPSTNALYRNIHGGRVKTARYKAWATEAAWEARIQKAGRVKGPYRLSILACRPDARHRDIDNLIKPISDALVRAGIVQDDSRCEGVRADWGGPGRIVIVTVEAA